jgi:hypothetical protein
VPNPARKGEIKVDQILFFGDEYFFIYSVAKKTNPIKI